VNSAGAGDRFAVIARRAVGDRIDFSGHATDPEDGALPAPRSRGRSDPSLHDADELPRARRATFSGASGFFNAPDHDYPRSSSCS
jgi:hypothetical protein